MSDNREWSRLIAQEKKTKSGILVLNTDSGENGLANQIPDTVFELTHLRKLELSGFGSLKNAARITELKNLNYLDLTDCNLTELPMALSSLGKLEGLNISNNNFSEVPPFLAELKQLTFLNLSHLRLSSLPSWLAALSKLTILDLQSNMLTSIPEVVFSFSNLISLHLGDNPLGTLDERVSTLRQLKYLMLYRTGISTLPASLKYLSELNDLALWNNKFEEIPEVVFELRSLKELSFTNKSIMGRERDDNRIKIIPRRILDLEQLKILDVSDNPIETPPPEVAAQGIAAIRNYYLQIDQVGTDFLYEAKLLIVGEGGAGKTTLVSKITDPNFELSEFSGSTQGIAVSKWQFDELGRGKQHTVHVNIWDFGGQEIYHSTHQFFLTKRSLYILVADTRKEDTDFYYWLNIIELLSDGSPTIIVKNEKQDRHREIDEKQLRARFKNLVAVVATNLATNRALVDLVSSVRHHISMLPHIGTPLPKTWVSVRRALEEHPENYISIEEFHRTCDEHGFTGLTDKLRLSEYLHDLGVCLHFGQDPLLRKILILKPRWGTDAVYRVLDNKSVISAYGRFKRTDLTAIWSERDYLSMRDELLQLMLNFKLCYAIPESKDSYIAPQLLSVSQPNYEWNSSSNLTIRYSYDFMPKGIITQLIVAMHKLISGNGKLVWKNGLVLEQDNTLAEVIEYPALREIRVRVRGRDKKYLLTIVAYELEKIHASFSQLKYAKLIPCTCTKCGGDSDPHFYQFDVLRKFASDGQRAIQCLRSYEMVNVIGLIDDIREVVEPYRRTTSEIPGFTFNAPVDTVVIGQLQEGKMATGDNPIRVRSAWLNGSFYLFVFVVVIGALGFSAQMVSGYILTLIILAGIIVLPVIGALQLRQDDRLSEKPFLELIKLALAQLPLLNKIGGSASQNSKPK